MVLLAQCGSQYTPVKPGYAPAIPDPEGEVVADDWCITTPRSRLFLTFLAELIICLETPKTDFLDDMVHMSRVMRKQTLCICENKDADQLRGNREADQRLCFRYIDSTIRLLSKSEISSP